jgi:Fic family protein
MIRNPYGDYVTTSTIGEKVRAFVPPPLPPLPPVEWTTQLIERFNDAHAALGRLDGISSIIPSKKVFIYSYVRKEAVLSSQIEGTQSSLADLLLYETDEMPNVPLDDVQEVSNYVAALNHGLSRLSEGFPLSLRLIKELHGVLLSRGKYASKSPGEFRNYQNWIGGTRPGNAVFVPTPPDRLSECLGKLEQFLHNDHVRTPTLLKAALAHVQFETIHPFPDGNGKVGRLLIALILCSEDLLRDPLLYLSLYFKTHRQFYYDLINKVRTDGDWESWLVFFADAAAETATQAVNTAHELLNLTKRDQETVTSLGRSGSLMLVYLTFLNRLVSRANDIGANSGLTPATVNKCLDMLERAGIITEITGQKRNRVFSYRTYIEILNRGLTE